MSICCVFCVQTVKEFFERRRNVAIFIVLTLVVLCIGIILILIFQEEPKTEARSLRDVLPELMMVPDFEEMRFNKNDKKTYRKYVKSISEFFDRYKDSPRSTIPCRRIKENNKINTDKACRVNKKKIKRIYQAYGCWKDNDFGFKYGEPCIILLLEVIKDWIPAKYLEDEERPIVAKNFARRTLPVACEAKSDTQDDDVLSSTVPENFGIPIKFFPFKKSMKNYQQPFVVMKFKNVTLNHVIYVECEAYAPNLIYGASVEFKLHVSD